MITEEERKNQVYGAWRAAADALSIRVEAPCLLTTPQGKQVLFAGRLLDFGGQSGMVFGLLDTVAMDKEVAAAAKSLGLYCSIINPEVYDHYDREVFQEALADWGFFGSEERRPDWLPKE